MSEQMATQMYSELLEIRALLARLEQQVEYLTGQLSQEITNPKPYTLSSMIGLGASGLTDISENHDRYLGEAIADEHLR